MIGSGERCSSLNLQIRSDNSNCSMNSSKSVGGQRKKRWVSPMYYCGSHPILFMSGTENNPNRLFFSFSLTLSAEAHCSFFARLDDYVSSFNEYAWKTILKGVLPQNAKITIRQDCICSLPITISLATFSDLLIILPVKCTL
ncbi:hypothetical protein AHAS_Ahas15G0228000 [Arachis hypogaea]